LCVEIKMEVTKKKEQEGQGQESKKPEIDPAIIKELMKGYQRPGDLSGPGGIMEQLIKRLYERVLGAEMTHLFGFTRRAKRPKAKLSRSARSIATGRAKRACSAKMESWISRCPEIRLGSLSRSLSARDNGALGASIPRLSPCTPKG